MTNLVTIEGPLAILNDISGLRNQFNRLFADWGATWDTLGFPQMNNTEEERVMTTQETPETRNVTGIQTAEPERVYTTTPRVDIREAKDCVVLRIDMPGVDERSASVLVENNELRIEGRTNVAPPEGHTLAREEFPPRFYRRTFDLSDQMNTENIRARICKGVLVLTIPVREAAKPRKVEVVAAA